MRGYEVTFWHADTPRAKLHVITKRMWNIHKVFRLHRGYRIERIW